MHVYVALHRVLYKILLYSYSLPYGLWTRSPPRSQPHFYCFHLTFQLFRDRHDSLLLSCGFLHSNSGLFACYVYVSGQTLDGRDQIYYYYQRNPYLRIQLYMGTNCKS